MSTASGEIATYANQRFSFDSDGTRVQSFTYVSEPLGNPAIRGFGWPRFEFEQVVGMGQYVLKRKLGWGMSSSIWLAYDKIPPFHFIKRIILHTLRGLAHMHKNGYIHTDLKLDNIFFSTKMYSKKMYAQEIKSMLETDPPRLHDPEGSLDGLVQAAPSQLRKIYIHDLLLSGPVVLQKISSSPLGAKRQTYGCLGVWYDNFPVHSWLLILKVFHKVYELVTGRMLFECEVNPENQLKEEADLLYQMMNVTGERFSIAQLSQAKRAGDYFDKDGMHVHALRSRCSARHL
ncbi:hypothetical protein C0992_001877 [Termitomyces sp. T32_za158]|nr:hypothetical protein C0992_001877 [Termitomyces sp. T32_za158]